MALSRFVRRLPLLAATWHVVLAAAANTDAHAAMRGFAGPHAFASPAARGRGRTHEIEYFKAAAEIARTGGAMDEAARRIVHSSEEAGKLLDTVQSHLGKYHDDLWKMSDTLQGPVEDVARIMHREFGRLASKEPARLAAFDLGSNGGLSIDNGPRASTPSSDGSWPEEEPGSSAEDVLGESEGRGKLAKPVVMSGSIDPEQDEVNLLKEKVELLKEEKALREQAAMKKEPNGANVQNGDIEPADDLSQEDAGEEVEPNSRFSVATSDRDAGDTEPELEAVDSVQKGSPQAAVAPDAEPELDTADTAEEAPSAGTEPELGAAETAKEAPSAGTEPELGAAETAGEAPSDGTESELEAAETAKEVPSAGTEPELEAGDSVEKRSPQAAVAPSADTEPDPDLLGGLSKGESPAINQEIGSPQAAAPKVLATEPLA